jgi:hypothetical protein
MAKTKSTSLKSIIISALVAATFVSAIAWGAFDDLTRVAIAAGITFVVVLLALSLLNWAAKDDNVKPGEPLLK